MYVFVSWHAGLFIAHFSEGSNLTPAHHYPDFRFKTYAPLAFRYFRDLFGIKPDDYLVRLKPLPRHSHSHYHPHVVMNDYQNVMLVWECGGSVGGQLKSDKHIRRLK